MNDGHDRILIFTIQEIFNYMDTATFVRQFREAFGEAARLPLIFGWSDTPAADTAKEPGCLFKYLRHAFDGIPVSISADNLTCGGGRFYTGFSPMPEHVPTFVSEKEKYKESPEKVLECIGLMDVRKAPGKWLNFTRVDLAESFDGMTGLLFIDVPDVISGLCAWAFYDSNDPETVCLRFGSGCASAVSYALKENEDNGFRTFVGLTDPSARIWFGADDLSFAIPASRFRTMAGTLSRSCLFDTNGWNRIRTRLNSVRRAIPSWAEEMNCAITVCDTQGVILYMNAASRKVYEKHGDLIGKNLMDCHSERSRAIIRSLLETGGQNAYTIEKGLVRKFIYQSAWKEDGRVMGLCEISMVIPTALPHYVRPSSDGTASETSRHDA